MVQGVLKKKMAKFKHLTTTKKHTEEKKRKSRKSFFFNMA